MYFSGICEEDFCGVTSQGCLVLWLCYLPLKLLIWVYTFSFYRKKVNFFCNQFSDLFFGVFAKFLKEGLTTLINQCFSFGLSLLIKSNLSFSLYYAEACNELAEPISASLRPGNTAPFEELSLRWLAVGNTVSDLTGPKFEPQTSRF